MPNNTINNKFNFNTIKVSNLRTTNLNNLTEYQKSGSYFLLCCPAINNNNVIYDPNQYYSSKVNLLNLSEYFTSSSNSSNASYSGSFYGIHIHNDDSIYSDYISGSLSGSSYGYFYGISSGSHFGENSLLSGSFYGNFSGKCEGTITGSVSNGVSFYGTSSRAIIAESASYVIGSVNNIITASYALTTAYVHDSFKSEISDFATLANTASYALTSAYAQESLKSETSDFATLANTASYTNNTISSSFSDYAISSSFSNNCATASYALVAESLKIDATTPATNNNTPENYPVGFTQNIKLGPSGWNLNTSNIIYDAAYGRFVKFKCLSTGIYNLSYYYNIAKHAILNTTNTEAVQKIDSQLWEYAEGYQPIIGNHIYEDPDAVGQEQRVYIIENNLATNKSYSPLLPRETFISNNNKFNEYSQAYNKIYNVLLNEGLWYKFNILYTPPGDMYGEYIIGGLFASIVGSATNLNGDCVIDSANLPLLEITKIKNI